MSETQPLIGNIGTGREGGSDKEEAVNNLLAYISFLPNNCHLWCFVFFCNCRSHRKRQLVYFVVNYCHSLSNDYNF